jgi:hypothetical protein
VLRRFDVADRLVWYNLHTSPPTGDSPIVGCRWFSSEVVLEILGRLGATTVRTLGIDGGTSYARSFSQTEVTRLDNGAPNFDIQFFELERIARSYGIDLASAVGPLRVFIGSDPSQQIARQVLEHSIRSHCSQPVEVIDLADHPTRLPKAEENRGRTAFSFARFRIPELCDYVGRALYLDADMLVFADISELWSVPFGERKVLCTTQLEPPFQWRDDDWFHSGPQMSVMLLDCSRLSWKVDDILDGLDAGEFSYADLMFNLCLVAPEEIGADLPPVWNHLEHHEAGETKLVHFTVVDHQPWKNDENPLAPLWESAFAEAVVAGAVPIDEVAAGIQGGYLKPSLARMIALHPRKESEDRAAAAARVHIVALQHEVDGLRRRAERAERTNAAMRRSSTWRIGRALLGPVSTLRGRASALIRRLSRQAKEPSR